MGLKKLKDHFGTILAIISLVSYIIILITFIYFLTTIFLLFLIIIIPLLFLGFIRKDKNLIFRRSKASCWALGVIILVIFPAFWLIPQQIYVRVNRQTQLITPDDPLVASFSQEFLAEHPNYDTLSFQEKAETVSSFTTNQIVWKVDYENYGLAGHVATPAQCITKRSDDCQGQAVTMASLLLHLGFEHVWAVETPFHWYVLVRDPTKGPLEKGWEAHVEEYQENGELLPLNRDGEGNMPEWRWEEVVLIFNDKETLYPVNFFEAVWIGWTATAFFYDDFFPMFLTYEIFYILIMMFALAVPMVLWTYYMTPLSNEKRTKDKEKAARIILRRSLILAPLLFLVFLLWFFLQPILWDYTMILSIMEITLISILASEPIFWKKLKL